jgi:(S)-2-hydroxyglutarate dehydrogenase
MRSADFVVIGGGIMGVSIAIELRRRHPGSSVLLLEKEDATGLHASGRNSGVLHSGFYYTADSLKARFTRVGNQLMRDYCEARGLRVNACGKLVVARDESELPGLAELLRRGQKNGVVLEEVDADQARRIEPRARTYEKALFSPNTATFDPSEVLRSMVEDAVRLGVAIELGCPYLGRRGAALSTPRGTFEYGYLVNAAGLYADTIARDFRFSERYRILPFKGLYLYSNEPAGAFRTNVYPVPDLAYPFLGVHFTLTVDGRVKIGPTAIPCLWREQYGWTENFRMGELMQVVGVGLGLLLRAGFDFRGLAREESKKYQRPYLVAQAATLADGVHLDQYTQWGKPGIRAQLVDMRERTLVQDFMIESDERSLHILNAVSPGWTCALPFSRFVCDRIDETLQTGRATPPAEAVRNAV